jgi:amino acid transporter
LLLFGYLNIIGVQKAGFIQTILSSMLIICVVTLTISGIVSAKSSSLNLDPIWGFDKSAAAAANATTANIDEFAHVGNRGIISAILATFAIAPWAYVGFDAIPQAAEEFNFSFKKVSGIMIVAIVFGGMPISGGPRSRIYSALMGGFSYILLNNILKMLISGNAGYGISQIVSAVFFLAVVYITGMNYRTKLLAR